jgi:antitoxin component of MazEF toxin-antitoxin module
MTKMLTKHGNSWALVIDRPVLELLGAGPDTPFEIVTDGRCLVLTPVRRPAEEKKFEKALETVHRRFGRAMKKLAE